MSAQPAEALPSWIMRPVRAGDLAAMDAFLAGLSLDTSYRRFFAGGRPSSWQVRRLVDVDHTSQDTWLATVGTDVIGAANYVRTPDGLADIAVVVTDGWQRRGVGTHLTSQLLRTLRRRGIEAVRATILAENRRMHALVRRHWPQARPEPSDDATVVEYVLPVRGPGATALVL